MSTEMMGGGYKVTPQIKGKLRPIRSNVIVEDMHFGDEVTKGGIIITNDDGKDRGIKPRWAKVYAKGPENKEPYEVGDWVLVEHGRWTRGFDLDDGDGNQKNLRMVEVESIMMYSTEAPERHATIGNMTGAETTTHRAEDFVTNG